jgi:hypothetical protein
MNDSTTYGLNPLALGLIVLVAAALGAALFAGGQWAYDEATGPTSIDGRAEEVGETEPSLDDAIHAAAEAAVEVEGGKYNGDTFEVARIELTAGNPHITAYRVILQPTGGSGG